MAKKISNILCVILGIFHLGTTALGVQLDAYVYRAFHLLTILTLLFINVPMTKKEDNTLNKYTISRSIDILLISISIIVGFYVIFNYEIIRTQAGLPQGYQVLLSILLCLAIIEGTRRTSGWAMVILALVAILYGRFGMHIPGRWGHPGFSFERIFGYLFLTVDGIWSTPLGTAAAIVVMFVMFGSFLEATGIQSLFADLALSIAGKTSGGPAHAAVISSALFGTVSGSAVANVVATGSFTIPMMKRRGYDPAFAGAVEAVASTGGQIMPPIMGAGAFIMAEMIGVPYSTIVKSAIIPATLYFLSCFVSVSFESKRIGLEPERNAEKLRSIMRSRGHQLIPLILMIVVISRGYSASMAALWGIAGCVVVSFFNKDKKDRITFKKFEEALINGIEGMFSVTSACACAGIILGVISMTGLGAKLTTLIAAISQGSVYLALILAMLAAIVLGMGLPTGAAYVIAAASVVPALTALGFEPIPAHLFVFYFAILGTITPPVCLSVYTAAGLAQAPWLQVAIIAIKMAIPGFLVPYLFVQEPALLLNSTLPNTLWVCSTSFIGVVCIAAGLFGFLAKPLNVLQRLILVIAGLLTLHPALVTDFAGLLILIVLFLYQKYNKNIETKVN